MSFEPVLFATPMFETANEAFLFCKDSLAKTGHLRASQYLTGLDTVNDLATGRLALGALVAAQPFVVGESREFVAIAINAMTRAVDELSDLTPVFSAVA